MVVSSIPELPLVCLKTADHDKNTREVTKGKNTVIGKSKVDSLIVANRTGTTNIHADHYSFMISWQNKFLTASFLSLL